MKNGIDKLGRVGFAFVIIAMFANVAFGIGTIYFNKSGVLNETNILDEKGNPLPDAALNFSANAPQKKIEIFYGDPSDPAKDSNANNFSFDPNSTRKIIFNDFGHNLGIRVWRGDPHAQGAFFGYTTAGYSVDHNQDEYALQDIRGKATALTDGTQILPVYNVIGAFSINRKYDKPYAPALKDAVESLVRDGVSDKFISRLSLSADYLENQNGIIIPATSYQWQIWKTSDPQNPYTPPDKTLSANIDAPNIERGVEYSFRVGAFNNWFQGGTWSSVGTFTLSTPIPDQPGQPANPLSFGFTLYGSQNDQIIVNSIAIPSNKLAKPEINLQVNKASDLAGVINRFKGKTIVTAIYKFDPANGTAQGAIFDTNGNLKSGDNFNLAPGIGYQVYTTEKVDNIVFEGQ